MIFLLFVVLLLFFHFFFCSRCSIYRTLRERINNWFSLAVINVVELGPLHMRSSIKYRHTIFFPSKRNQILNRANTIITLAKITIPNHTFDSRLYDWYCSFFIFLSFVEVVAESKRRKSSSFRISFIWFIVGGIAVLFITVGLVCIIIRWDGVLFCWLSDRDGLEPSSPFSHVLLFYLFQYYFQSSCTLHEYKHLPFHRGNFRGVLSRTVIFYNPHVPWGL